MLKTLPLLALCFGVGVLLRRLRALPANASEVLNTLILHVLLPAVILRALHTLTFQPQLLLAAGMMWAVFAVAWILFSAWRRRGLEPGRAGALILTAGFCNTAYLGLPMVEGLLGPQALPIAVVVDQLGSFLAVSTVGVAFATAARGGAITKAALLRRVALFPPFIALVVALLSRPFAYPALLSAVLDRLADLMTPLALISVGFQLELRAMSGRAAPLVAGLVYKLALAPALTFAILYGLGVRGLLLEVAVLQAAMAPMVTGAILATDAKQDPPLATLLLGVGIPLSFLTVPAIAWLLAKMGTGSFLP